MKLLFVRHGESLDDIYNEFGGWNDRELSPRGVKTAFELVEETKALNEEFELILTSPLKRCSETADILGRELDLRVEMLPYLKERNTYGLLNGVPKDKAENEYPEIVRDLEKNVPIPGGERYADFVDRIRYLFRYLADSYENDSRIVCVTHGHLITAIIEEVLGKIRGKIQDGSWIYIEYDKFSKVCSLMKKDGLSFIKAKDQENEKNKRKY